MFASALRRYAIRHSVMSVVVVVLFTVCLVAGSYVEVLGIVRDYIQPRPEASRQKILGTNAAGFYGVKPISQ